MIDSSMRIDMKKRELYFKKEMAVSSDQQLSRLDISRGVGIRNDGIQFESDNDESQIHE